MAASLPPGLTRGAVDLFPKNHGMMRTLIQQGSGNGFGVASISTISTQFGLESDFDLVRLIWQSDNAAGYTIGLTKVSPSGSVNDNRNPTNAAAAVDQTMWKTITFNNGGLAVLPGAQTNWTGTGTTTLTVPGNSVNVSQPTHYFSDWLRISSLALTDGTFAPLLLVRTLTDATATFRGGFSNSTQWPAFSPGRPAAGAFSVGDYVTNIAAPPFPGSGSNLSTTAAWGVQYNTRVPGFSLLVSGDSWSLGVGSTSGQHGWGVRAAQALSTPALPISCANHGWSGQISSDFWANAYAMFAVCQPDIVTIPVWTPNDTNFGVQSVADTAFSRAMDYAHYARKNGAIPVLFPPFPWENITTAAQEAVRLTARTRMLQAAASGVVLAMDFESILGTGANPNRLQAQYESASPTDHPNDAAYVIMDTQFFRPILRRIIGI